MGINRTPALWTAGEIPSAAKMQAEVAALWTGLQAPWDTYTPSWTASGTNPSLGNGSLTGRFFQMGKTIVSWSVNLTIGSTTTFGTGQWLITPPSVAPTGRYACIAEYLDLGTAQYTGRATFTGTQIYMFATPTTAGGPDRPVAAGTVPFNWTTGDQLNIAGMPYEIG